MGFGRHLSRLALLSLLSLAGIVTARNGSQTASKAAAADASAVHGIDPADMDRTTRPCDDFYKYADGGWLMRNPIPPEYPSWRMMVTVNPHPLGRFRAIGPPSNLSEFAKAFGCTTGDSMVRAQLCQIW